MSVLSVVIPSYNEEPLIRHTAAVLGDLLTREKIAYELIFVDDGSKDRTWDEVAAAREKDPCVHGVRFSRNFGKEAAIFAGLAQAEGSCAAVMDCDLQHPPGTLVEMYRLWEQGYEVVEGVKKTRGKESGGYRFAAGMFYRLMSRAIKIDMSRASDFKLLDRRAVDSLLAMPERGTFFRAMSSWIGFRKTSVEFDVQEREAGESKWTVRSLISYAVANIVGYSSVPMQFVTGAGIVVFLLAVILPGNHMLPFSDLAVLTFRVALVVAICRGNMFRSLIISCLVIIAILYGGTAAAPYMTQLAINTGLDFEGQLIASMTGPSLTQTAIIFWSFVKNPYVLVPIVVAAFLGIWWFVEKKVGMDKIEAYAAQCDEDEE